MTVSIRRPVAATLVALTLPFLAHAQCPSNGVATQTVGSAQPHPPVALRSNEVFMAYDRARHATVALNQNPSTGLFEEWVYDAGAWTNTTSGFASMIYGIVFDPARGRLVAAGKHQPGDTFSSTWVRLASGWVRNSATFPSTSVDAGNVVYDASRDRYDALVLVDVGGSVKPAVAEIDPTTWAWTVGSAYPGDVGLDSETMAYDPIAESLQFWGFDSATRERVVTCRTPGTWADLPLSNPVTIGAIDYSTSVWVDRWQCMVISRGVHPATRYTNSSQNAFSRLYLDGAPEYECRKSWDFARYPDTGNNQPTRIHVGIAYDSDRHTLVVFGGEYYYLASLNPPVGDLLAHDKTYELPLPAGPAINVQPTDYTGCIGDVHDLSFVPDLGAPQDIQWFFRPAGTRGFQPITGATTLSYPNRPWQASDNGTYLARVTRPPAAVACDARVRTWTNAVEVRVDSALLVTGQPQWPADACPGQAVMIVGPQVAGPNPTLALQKQTPGGGWNDVSFATPEEPIFFLSNLSQADSGVYRINARNACSSFVTPEHRIQVGVTLDGPITLTGTPAPCGSVQIRPLNSAINSTGPVSYQWLLDGVPIPESSRVQGTQMSTLSITSLHYSDAGRYELRVSEGACHTSASASRDLALPEPATISYVARALPDPLPPARQAHAMAYDEARGVVVLFGGIGRDTQNQPVALADTWTYDGEAWIQRSPAHSPGRVSNAAMVYDRDRARVILFGGNHALCATCAAPPKAETWEWDGSDWTLRSATGPADDRASNPALAYDLDAKRVVLYTGANPSSTLYRGETWLYDPASAQWTNPSLLGPGTGNGFPAMYYDAFRQRRVMYAFGPVVNPSDSPTPAFWEWNGTQWIAALADLAGTWQSSQQPFPYGAFASNTWAYNPSTRKGESGLMTVIPPGGGGTWSGTYTYDGLSATRRLTNNSFGRSNAAQVWDAKRRCMVIFGGQETYPGSPAQGRPTNTTFERHAAAGPVILDHPWDAAVAPRSALTLRVVAAGDPTLQYRWKKNGTPLTDGAGISGAFTSTLAFASIAPGDSGLYSCQVSNGCASVESRQANVSACAVDLDDGTGTGTRDAAVGIEDLIYFLAAFERGDAGVDLDDGTLSGTPDGGVDVADLVYFLVHFEEGC